MNNPTFFAILDACQQPGCPICRVVEGAVERSLGHLFYESVTDPAVRLRLRKSLGFCHTHAWLVLNLRLGDALGMAIIYQDLLGSILKHLPHSASLHRPLNLKNLLETARHALTHRQRCPACEEQETAARMAVLVLAASLKNPEFLAALQDSQGLCLPHLRQALEHVQDLSALNALLSLSRENIERLHAELTELIRKNDYRFRDEPIGAEGDAWRRVVSLVVGADPHPRDM